MRAWGKVRTPIERETPQRGAGWIGAFAHLATNLGPDAAIALLAMAELIPAVLKAPEATVEGATAKLDDILSRHPLQPPPAPPEHLPAPSESTDASDAALARECHGAVNDEIEQARSESEREILAAGGKLANIYRETSQHASALKEIRRRFADQGQAGAASFGSVINEQSASLSELPVAFDTIRERLEAQRGLTASAGEHTSRILSLASTIGRITNTINILGINALITATQAGEHGAAFAVVAKELRALSTQTKQANESISSIAGELSNLLPKLRSGGGEIAELCQMRSDRLKETISDLKDKLQATYGGIQASMVTAVDEAVARGEAISNSCNDVLSHLMFQDRLNQRLISAKKISDLWLAGDSLVGQLEISIGKLRVGAERLTALKGQVPIHATASATVVSEADAGELTFL